MNQLRERASGCVYHAEVLRRILLKVAPESGLHLAIALSSEMVEIAHHCGVSLATSCTGHGIAMPIIHFITHPEVVIDPDIPVPDWPLSSVDIRRMRVAVGRPWVTTVRSVFSSRERKALDAANVLAEHLRGRVHVIDTLGENDRSATGYLARGEFEAVADQFFARPDKSIRGWERAGDAQCRIVRAVKQAIASSDLSGDIAIVSHGAVGALLLCDLKGVPISRTEDQPGGGGGNFFSFDLASRRLLSGWRRIDA